MLQLDGQATRTLSARSPSRHNAIGMIVCRVFALLPIAGVVHATPLSLDEQVACQTAVDEVRWAQMNWPESNTAPKPPLSVVISPAEIEGKVLESRRQTAALAELYDIEISPDHLQAELDRIAAATKAPDQLRALYAALNHDPALIAACVVQPLLVGQQLRHSYEWDPGRHDALRDQAQMDLRSGLKRANAHDVRYLREDTTHATREHSADGAIQILLSPDEWIERIAQVETNDAIAKRSPSNALRETRDAFIYERILDRGESELKVRVHTWPKRGFGAWWDTESGKWDAQAPELIGSLTLRPVTAVTADVRKGDVSSWQPGADAPIEARSNHTTLWTGSEMLVWGGYGSIGHLDNGASYNPMTDSWTPVDSASPNRPSARRFHSAAWTGAEMIIWGGRNDQSALASGARYDPLANSWESVSTQGSPAARNQHAAVWTGSEMMIWGGRSGNANSQYFSTGGRYNPDDDTWSPTATLNAPSRRVAHSMVWTGDRAIVWGGYRVVVDGFDWIYYSLFSGGIYDPVADSWNATPDTGGPEGRWDHSAVWTGTEMIIWGGDTFDDLGDGRRYVPESNVWLPLSIAGAPTPRRRHSAVWTGNEMIVWGGGAGSAYVNTGSRYNPVDDSWTPMTDVDAPVGRSGHSAVWTGESMLVWGGLGAGAAPLNHLGIYTPGETVVPDDVIFQHDFELAGPDE